MSKLKISATTKEMLRMRLSGKTLKAIGKKYGITRQAVGQRLKPFPVRKRFVRNGAESAQGR